jgi:hypothetical protein
VSILGNTTPERVRHRGRRPSRLNEAAFNSAVEAIAKVSTKLLDALETNAPPKNRADEAVKARNRCALRELAWVIGQRVQ